MRTFAFAHYLEKGEGQSNCRCVTRVRPDACSANGRLVYNSQFSVYVTRRDLFGALQREVGREAITDLVAKGIAADAASEERIKRRSAENLDAAFERQVSAVA